MVAGTARFPVRDQSRRRHRESERSEPEDQERTDHRRAHQYHVLSNRMSIGVHMNSSHRLAGLLVAALTGLATGTAAGTAYADTPKGFLETVHKHVTLASTVPDNGDQNPYALAVAPVSAGTIQKGDVLVDNFNNATNLQGTGTTIVDYNPETKKLSLFAQLPKDLKGCPG